MIKKYGQLHLHAVEGQASQILITDFTFERVGCRDAMLEALTWAKNEIEISIQRINAQPRQRAELN